jgi:4-amino-4-deoxy-L-arabinose transferase-like glycosyltransferase
MVDEAVLAGHGDARGRPAARDSGGAVRQQQRWRLPPQLHLAGDIPAVNAAAMGLTAAAIVAGGSLLLDDVAAAILSAPPYFALLLYLSAGILALGWRALSSSGRAIVQTAAVLLSASSMLTLYVLQRVPLLGPGGDHRGVFFAWAIAVMLYVAAFSAPGAWRLPNPIGRLRQEWAVAAMLLGATLVAAFVRLWHLGTILYVFHGDEAGFALSAADLSTNPLSNLFGTGFMSQPTMGMFPEFLSTRLLGASPEAARMPWAMMGIVTVPVAYFLAARLRGTTIGLVTATLVAVYHFHIHYSRTALNNVADPLVLAVALLALVVALERRTVMAWSLVGVSCGMALYFYQGARLTPLVVAAVLAYASITQTRAFRSGLLKGAAIALGACGVAAAPMLQFAWRFPNDFNARINAISIFAPGWLQNEAIATGQSTLAILWRQAYRAVLAFNVFPDTSPHYFLPTPLLDPLFGVVFLLGLLWATGRALFWRQDWRLLTMVVWWWGGVLIGGALTMDPPQSQRLITLAVPVCFFIALAIDLVAGAIRRLGLPIPKVALQLAGTSLFAVISLKTFFVDYAPSPRSGSAAVMMELVPILKGLEPKTSVMFAGAPQLFWGFATRAFLVPEVKGQDLLEPITVPPPLDMIGKGETAMFVFLPGRIGELDYVRQTFPDGVTSTIGRPDGKEVFATLYKVSR